MSDEPIRLDPQTAPVPAGIFEHYCEHAGCSSWGAWGYQIGRQTARYFCFEHREEGERMIGRTWEAS